MKRCLLGVTLLGALSLIVVACGGQASEDASPAQAADAANTAQPPSDEETIAVAETESTDAEATRHDKRATQGKNAKKNRKKNKKQQAKKLQVAVALGAPNEFDLAPAKRQVRAGMVTFKLKNTGAIEHELVAIRTDLDPAELPTDENGAAVEHGAIAPHGAGHDGAEPGAAHVGTHVPSGQATSVALKLEPGTYALVCNLPGHYAAGMHSSFTVVT